MRQAIALVLGALIVAVPAVAQQAARPGPGPMGSGMHEHGMMGGPMGGPMMGGGGHGMMMGMGLMPVLMMNADELKLTDEQVGKLHRIHMKHMGAGQDMMRSAHKSKEDVMAALANPGSDEAAIRAAAKAHSDAFTKLIDDAVAERNEMLAVLSADQKTKLKTMKAPEMPGDEPMGH